jgi:N-acetylmuramoyl-L-alanine amidase
MLMMRRATGTLLGLLLAAVSLAAQGASPQAPLRLVASDGSRTLPTIVSGDTELIAFDDLAAFLKVAVREDALARAFTVSYKGKTIVLSQNQALASISGRLVSLPASPVRLNNRWYVPVEFIGRALALVYDTPLELRKASRLVILGPLRVPRVVVHHDVAGAQARITLDVVPGVPHQVMQEPSRLLIKFTADLLDLTLPAFQSQGIVTAIHVGEPQTTLVVELGPRFGSARASDAPLDPDGARVTLDLFAAQGETSRAEGAPPASEASPLRAEGTPPASGASAPIVPGAPTVRTIVLDPGHGGEELGAKGSKGALEKAIALSVARRLKSSLEGRLGARVLLTREDDRSVGLDERAALANNNKADLFLSLHANASLRRAASGAEVFYLSLDRADEEARKVAESEGVAMPVFGGGTREIDVILWEMAQARHIEESAGLARAIEVQLRTSVPMSPRAIQQAPFRVLVGANMPAVLVELGYLTNVTQEGQLSNPDFQARVVASLTEAIRRFFAGEIPSAPTAPSPDVPAPAAGKATAPGQPR